MLTLTPQYMGITTILSHRAQIVYRAPIAARPDAYTLITLPGSYASIDEAQAIAQELNKHEMTPAEARNYVAIRRTGGSVC